MDIEAEVSVKDIVNFYIKINDAVKAKKDIAQLSSKDKLVAFEIIVTSQASREFKVEVAKYFLYDLDNRVRRKCKLTLENLVPGWVSDPAESILKLLKSTDDKGVSRKNAAVKFLFGIVDSCSLRDTFMTLLNSRNRAHMAEIIAILEDYIDCSLDEQEQVKIFDACLDIVLSEDADHNIKHHASNLLSVFFKKVETTMLGETLRQKYIERQVQKAEGVYRYLCSGVSGLNTVFLDDLLRPLNDGGKVYQLKILNYFSFIIEKIRNPAEIDNTLDIYPDYWNKNEPTKEEKIKIISRRIMQSIEQLWDNTEDNEVRELVVRIKYNEYLNKKELFEQIKGRIENETLSETAREKIALMLRCFLQPNQEEGLKLLAADLLLFKFDRKEHRLAALEYLKLYVESKNLNSAEKGSIAAVMESLLDEQKDQDILDSARYILFIVDPTRFASEDEQKAILGYLRQKVEWSGFSGEGAEKQILHALDHYIDKIAVTEKLKKAAQYLEFKIKTPKSEKK
ncbi:MAG TPA: hypothetical protein VGJ93_14740 [Desulfuromonadaceae bacterium]|jgi:hypothetical protein